uniref:Uncharacterized protein n=1 Tax=Arion vulgaris TaxID=1028688 RepID=A0A0B6Y2D4_9EUPU
MATTKRGGPLHQAINSVRCDIQEVLQSGNYYVTEEIAREMSVINNSLEHLSLDNIFLTTSNNWQTNPGNYTANQTVQHLSGALAAVFQVAGNLDTFKQHFCNENVAGKQENQLREVHQWAISSLKDSQKKLEPYTFDAADRIKQFGDILSVTDRYTGYRQNLTRGTRDPFRMQATWIDKGGELGLMNNLTRSYTTVGSPALEQRAHTRSVELTVDPSAEFSQFGGVPPANIGTLKKQIRYGNTHQPMRITRGYRTIDSLYPKSTAPMSGGIPVGSSVMDEVQTLNTLNACDLYEKMNQFNRSIPVARKLPYENMSVQEQAGIKTKFPSQSEYTLRFKTPDRDGPVSDFKINPAPDFSVYGRPIESTCYMPSFTEYQSRYEWPDASKIMKTPWLRN